MRLCRILLAGMFLRHITATTNTAGQQQSAGNAVLSEESVADLLNRAQSHLSRGETHEALEFFDAAVARDPSDYLTFFKRATTHLSMGRLALASRDFARALELEPGFEGAHIQLAKISARHADWERARHHYAEAHRGPDSAEIAELDDAQDAARLVEIAQKAASWDECIQQANSAILVANQSPSLRLARARCRLETGALESAVLDLERVLQLTPGNTSIYFNISAILTYGNGDLQSAMTQTRRCLQSDPDSQACRKLLKKEKTIDKALEKSSKLMGKTPMAATRILVGTADEPGLIADVRADMRDLVRQGVLPEHAPKRLYSKLIGLACRGYYEVQGKHAQKFCDESLELDPSSLYGLLNRARTLVTNESFEAAINTYEQAKRSHGDQSELINKLIHEAQVALKRSQNKDYYKILGVNRDADSRQIKSAYRKLTKQYHPDKAATHGLTREDSERKMAQINEAYEVLNDPELKARFDRGDDPNSPVGHGGGAGGFPFNPNDPFSNMFQQGSSFKFHAGGGGGFQGFRFG